VLIGKLVLAYLPYPLVGIPALLLLALLEQPSLLTLLNGIALLLLMGLGSASLSLGLGAAFPRLNWENPQQQTSLVAGCLSALLMPLYIGLIAAVIGIPFWLALLVDLLWLQLLLGGLGWLLALVLTVLVMTGSLAAGRRSLERLEL
jgi:hypothetical protein